MRNILITLISTAALVACTADTRDPASSTPLESASPTAVATADPTPEPTETATSSAAATPSPTADTDEAGFEDGAECENEDMGYEVAYPADWWANERLEADDPVADIPACTYFAPAEVQLEPGTDDLAGIAIRFELVERDVERGGEILLDEQTTVDDHEARVLEREPDPQPGFIEAGESIYQYVITLEDGNELVATTDTINQEESAYEDSKSVLDTMMETIDIDD